MRKKILSTKDLAYIKDMFNWNDVIICKYKLYLDLSTEEEITNKLNELITIHQEFCNTLIKILEGEINKWMIKIF